MTPKPRQVGKILSEEGLAKDLQYVLRGIAVHEVLATVCPPRPGLRVLEAGCGSGKLGIWYALRGAKVMLLDVDRKALDYASELWGRVSEATGQELDAVLMKGARHVSNYTITRALGGCMEYAIGMSMMHTAERPDRWFGVPLAEMCDAHWFCFRVARRIVAEEQNKS